MRFVVASNDKKLRKRKPNQRRSKKTAQHDLLTVPQLRAEYPMLGRSAAYRIARELGRRLGRRLYVLRTAVDAWLAGASGGVQ
jgi:hypothetical protein